MNDFPQITWLMAVRNGMPYLPETLASLEKQTYRNHKILVWDNASTDGTLEELRRWIPSRLPGEIIAGRPLGLGASRAALVEAAPTELCAWTDSEDISAPERLGTQLDYLNQHPEACAIGSQVDFIDERGRPMPDAWVLPTDDAEIRWGARWRPLSLHATFLFRRSKILEAGNYRDCKPMEDHDILIRLAQLGKMPNLPDRLYKWRRHSRSITTQIPDHYNYHRECARMNSEILFPGTPSSEAMRLWDLLYKPQSPEPVSFADLRLFHRAAKALAKATGEDERYFTGNRFYLEQRYFLRQRRIETMGLKSVLLLKRRVQSAFAVARR